MTEKKIEINGKTVSAGAEVFLRVILIKESGTGGVGYNLEINPSQGGVVIHHGKITFINTPPDKIVIPD